jgi:hypothetical protein
MAVSKKSGKTTRSSRTAGKTKRSRVKVSRNKIVFGLSAADAAKAKKCLQDSGAIKFTFKEVKVTRLPDTKDDGVLID